jgi:hypothetical protein
MSDLVYGPQTEAILALIERAGHLTGGEVAALAAAWTAAWDVAARSAMDAARDAWAATRVAARDTVWDAWAAAWSVGVAVGDAVGDAWSAAMATWAAALALATRDRLDRTAYDALTGPWGEVIGQAHPDDPDRRGRHHDQ